MTELTPEFLAQSRHEDSIAEGLVDEIFDRTDNLDEAAGVVHALFLWMVHSLVEIGWTSEELQREVAWHVASHTSVGPMQ